MAQTLKDQCTYNLLTNESDIEKKHVYFVKLTDSCLKAIEEHVYHSSAKNAPSSASGGKPKIMFDGTSGLLKIPSKTAAGNSARQFQFGVSNLQANAQHQGIAECIMQPPDSSLVKSSADSRKLYSFGGVTSKIAVMATEDVYENTKNRMNQADQERKATHTKEIKLNVDKKKSKKAIIQPAGINVLKKPGSSNSPQIPKSNPSLAKTFSSPSSSTKQSPINKPPVAKQSPINKPPVIKPPVVKKGFSSRERVIHILALRPHKKIELLSRLQKEAMPTKDTASIQAVLKQVSTVQGNELKLQKYWYQEIQVETWPFYSDSEREIAKKNIKLNSSDGGSQVDSNTSPTVTSTSRSPDEKNLKRPAVVGSSSSLKRPRYDDSTADASTSKRLAHKPVATTTMSKMAPPVKTKPRYEEESPPTVASTSLTPEYINNYTTIHSYEQRSSYKNDFQKEYPEYRRIKEILDAITRKFIELDQSWKRAEAGSPEHIRLQDEICSLYEKHQQDPEYKELKQRCQDVHRKLEHIKILIAEYDDKNRLPDT